jgi:hypothetical protein
LPAAARPCQSLHLHVDHNVHAFHRERSRQDRTFALYTPRPGYFSPVFPADFNRFEKSALRFLTVRKSGPVIFHDRAAGVFPEAFGYGEPAAGRMSFAG